MRCMMISKFLFHLATNYSVISKYSLCRHVATWSPLAFAFNAKSSKMTALNYKIFPEQSGLFGYTELQDPTGFYLLKESAVVHTDCLVQEALNPKRRRKMVQIFDELSNTLCKVADLAEFIRIGHPNEKFAYAAGEASITISNIVEQLNTNRELYDKLRSVVLNGDVVPTDPVDDHVAKLFLFDFEQCGIHLKDSDREKVVSYNDYILHVGSHFMNHSLNPQSVPKRQLPKAIQDCFGSEEHVTVSGIFVDTEIELIREAAYKIFLFPNKKQEGLLNELLSARHKLATLCGFESYVHRAVKNSIASDPEFVKNFLHILNERIRPRAELDYAKMLHLKQSCDTKATNLMPWDVPYFMTKSKQQMFDIKTSNYCSYFSLGACMDGLNMVFNTLFNVSLDIEEPLPGEVWHEDVKKLAVTEKGNVLGYIYCDFFERPSKPNQDCHFTIQGGKLLEDGTYQKPIVVLLLNLPSPTWTTPSLLTHSMLDNLFHEMGHAMHSMLAQTVYQHVTGTRCSTDLAEVPSVLMEYFATDPRVISKFARHYKTGEAIPLDLVMRLWKSKRVFTACETQLQVFYSAFDQACHGVHPLGCSTTDLLAKTQNLYYGLPHVPDTAWQLRFGHLVGYGAKYYSYLISRSVASWIWHSFFRNEPFNSIEGEKYRKGVLEHGGSKPPRSLVQDFLATDITPESLAEALLKEIDYKSMS